jgi:hypothetical protein
VADDDPDAIAGVPLTSVETAATAAVRLGYKIASAQLDRSARIATRLREEGDRAAGVTRDTGDSSEKRALDATEQLILKTMLAGLAWLEGFAAAPGNPVKRVAAAEFRILGSLFGLLPDSLRGGSESAETIRNLLQQLVDSTESRTASGAREGGPVDRRPVPGDTGPAPGLRIKHSVSKDGAVAGARAIRVVQWEIMPEATGTFPVVFYGDDPQATPLRGKIIVPAATTPAATPMLALDPMGAVAPRGTYRAAICDPEGLQLGYIEVAV